MLEGAKFDDIMEVSGFSGREIEDKSAELIRASLINCEGIDSETKFFLHPITYYFVQEKE